jgi:antitoxin component YwqK of YwqJK toxin-antitoxin module
MKNLILLILILFSTTYMSAQNDTTIIYLDRDDKPAPEQMASKYAIQVKEKDHWKKVVFDYADDKPIFGAYYSDAACTQFDGPYSAFNKENKVIEKGRYLNNKKNGVWLQYAGDGKVTDSAFYKNGFIYGLSLTWYLDGTVQDSLLFEDNGNGACRSYWPDGHPKGSGKFINGKKDGSWIYNHKNGVRCQEVNYAADSALHYTCYDEKGNIQTSNCIFEKAWLKYLGGKLSTVQLPKAYYDGKLYGTIFIQFVIDTDGKVTDVKSINSIDPELDEIAKNIIRQSPRWEAAVQYNRNVNAYRKQPLTFSKAE